MGETITPAMKHSFLPQSASFLPQSAAATAEIPQKKEQK